MPAPSRILSDCTYKVHYVGENRHGNLGTLCRDGDGDNPLLNSKGPHAKAAYRFKRVIRLGVNMLFMHLDEAGEPWGATMEP